MLLLIGVAPAFAAANPILPATGNPAGGTTVTISGTDFVPGTNVDFGGSACTNVAVVTPFPVNFLVNVFFRIPAQITCTTPAHVAGAVDVTITNPDGQTVTLPGSFTYQGPPTVATIAPVAGALAGGTNVTITGADFVAGATVDLGGSACNITNLVANRIDCTTTAHVAGAVDVTVTNPDGQSGALASIYTYQEAPTVTTHFPIAGALGGGTPVTIVGTGFLAGATVDFGGSACGGVTVNSATELTCTTTGHGAGAVDVTVTNADNQAGTLNASYTYQAGPTVNAVAPNAGPLAGGTNITIQGTDFAVAGITTVDFGITACANVIVNNANQITCDIPAGVGAEDVTVVNPDGQSGTLSPGYTYQVAPAVTSITPNGGTPLGGNAVTITGTGFVAGAGVDFGGNACGPVVVNSSTEITCTVPAGVLGAVDVTVTNADNQAGTLNASYTYQNAPTINAVNGVCTHRGTSGGGKQYHYNGNKFSHFRDDQCRSWRE